MYLLVVVLKENAQFTFLDRDLGATVFFLFEPPVYYSTYTDLSPLVVTILDEPPGDPPGDEGVHNIQYIK